MQPQCQDFKNQVESDGFSVVDVNTNKFKVITMSAKSVADFRRQIVTHAGRTKKNTLQSSMIESDLKGVLPTIYLPQCNKTSY